MRKMSCLPTGCVLQGGGGDLGAWGAVDSRSTARSRVSTLSALSIWSDDEEVRCACAPGTELPTAPSSACSARSAALRWHGWHAACLATLQPQEPLVPADARGLPMPTQAG